MKLFRGKGVRNFENCQVHTLPDTTVDTMAYGLNFGAWFNARFAKPDEKIHRIVSVQCPKLGEYALNAPNSTVAEANRSLIDAVAGTVCKNCIFAGMSPIEVANYQKAIIDAQPSAATQQWQQPPLIEQAQKQLPPTGLR